jgi:metallo-beta-lactamase class B
MFEYSPLIRRLVGVCPIGSRLPAVLMILLSSACAARPDVVPRHFPSALDSQRDWLAQCEGSEDWERPGPPFRIYGDSYYVGTCGITAILIAGDEGHVLIDSGTGAGGRLVEANVQALGFALDEIKILLHTQEHFDHVAGLAGLQRASGARLLASAKAAQVFRTGTTHQDDPQAGTHAPFPAARVDGLVTDGDVVRLGRLVLTPMATPGHSAGALSWQWRECEGDRCLTVLYSDGLSPLSRDDYRFSDHPDYLDQFRASFRKIREASCDIFLTPHPVASGMPDRIASAAGLIDDRECGLYAADIEAQLDRRLAREGQ